MRKEEKIIICDTVYKAKKYFMALLGINVTKHRGKMENIPSISTYAGACKHCLARCINKALICFHCFAMRMTENKKGTNLKNALIQNTDILTKPFTEEQCNNIPILDFKYFRFESFGDLHNEYQCINYFNITDRSFLFDTLFGLWSKNLKYVHKAIEIHRKPEKLQFNFSIARINPFENDEQAEQFYNRIKKRYPEIDRIFCVYTKDYLKTHPDIHINCGSKDCFNCGICYEKNNIHVVNEIKK